MNVRMPDGTIIQNVPDGVTQEELLQLLNTSKTEKAVQGGKRELANSLPWHEAAMIGAGKGGDSMWAGLQQLGLGLTGAAANVLPQSGAQRQLEEWVTRKAGALDADQRDKAAEYEILARERPVVTGLGEGAATFAIPGAAAVRGAKGAEMLMNAAAQGAVPGMLGYGTPQEKMGAGAAGALGGAAGGAIGIGLGRIAQPFRPAENQTRAAALKAAEDLGLKLTPAEITGSRPLKWAQAALDDLPFAAGMGSARRAGNDRALAAAALKDIGQDGTEVTGKALSSASGQIGQKFDDVFKAARVPVPDEAVGKLAQINDEALRFLPPDQARVVANRIDEILGKVESDGAIQGLAYQKWRASAKSANGDANHYLKQAKAVVDEAATAALSTEKMAAFGDANKQWAALKTLMTGNVVNRDTGAVMPKQLDNALAKRYGDAYRKGELTGNLPQIAKTAGLLREMPQSGTAPRALYTGGMGAGGMGMAAGVLDPLTLGGAAAAPVLAQLAMNNPLARHYVSKGMFAVTPEMERWLLRLGGGVGAGHGLASLEGGGR